MTTEMREVTVGPDPIVCGDQDGNPATVFLPGSPPVDCSFCRRKVNCAIGRRTWRAVYLPTICVECAKKAVQMLEQK